MSFGTGNEWKKFEPYEIKPTFSFDIINQTTDFFYTLIISRAAEKTAGF